MVTDEYDVEKVDVNVDVYDRGEIENEEEAEFKRKSLVVTDTSTAPTRDVNDVEDESVLAVEAEVENAVS